MILVNVEYSKVWVNMNDVSCCRPFIVVGSISWLNERKQAKLAQSTTITTEYSFQPAEALLAAWLAEVRS